MNENPLDPKDNSDSTDSLPDRNSAEPTLTRRSFLGKIIVLGALTHFTPLINFAGNADDTCLYGRLNENDICEPENGNSDKCADGAYAHDDCSPSQSVTEDYCPTGKSPDDVCDTQVSGSDTCIGGGATTGGTHQDTCESDGTDDQCTSPVGGTQSGGGHDRCGGDTFDQCDESTTETQDVCGVFYPLYWSDDTCYNGTNSWTGSGGDDLCRGNMGATDSCPDGSEAQDLCLGYGDEHGGDDVCTGSIGTGNNMENTDKCSWSPIGNDPDVCTGYIEGDDVCPGGGPSHKVGEGKDACPEGMPPEDYCPPRKGGAEDVCFSGTIPEDICDAYAKEPD